MWFSSAHLGLRNGWIGFIRGVEDMAAVTPNQAKKAVISAGMPKSRPWRVSRNFEARRGLQPRRSRFVSATMPESSTCTVVMLPSMAWIGSPHQCGSGFAPRFARPNSSPTTSRHPCRNDGFPGLAGLVYYDGNCSLTAIKLSRHTGMDCRYPEHREVNLVCPPWPLGSGIPCRNDGLFLNLMAVKLAPRNEKNARLAQHSCRCVSTPLTMSCHTAIHG